MSTKEAVIIRNALDILKEKFRESEGAWAFVDFMGAASNKSHWMHKVVAAEKLVNSVLGERP